MRAPRPTSTRLQGVTRASTPASGERYEAHRQQLPRRHPPVGGIAFDEHEILERKGGADWDHHSAARLQLADQRRRDMARLGSNKDGVEGCRFLPAVIALARPRRDAPVAAQ